MHDQAHSWVAQFATDKFVSVLDIGGRDINGSPRGLFPNASPYTVLDIAPGDGVEIVANAATWEPIAEFDIVVCCEVFEHTNEWREICDTAYKAVKPGGTFIVTCAAPGRPEHSAVDGSWQLYPGEYYGNVAADDLGLVLTQCGFIDVRTDQTTAWPNDTRAVCVRKSENGSD